MASSKYSEHCFIICLLGLTSVTYVTLGDSAILSYSMPVGQTTRNGRVHYKDTSYNGVIINDFYKNGTGILVDGKFGPGNAKLLRGEGWVGWSSFLTQSQYIDITFEFSGVRKFTNVILTANVDKKRARDNAVFNQSQIFFSSTQDSFSDTSFLQYCPRDFQGKDDPYNANVTLSLCENTARFIKLRLYFSGRWLLISEISFNSVPASKDEKKLLQSCSGKTSHSCPVVPTTIPQLTNTKAKPGYNGESTNSTGLAVGIVLTLAIVFTLNALLVILPIYKRRRQATKLSTTVNTVEMQNQSPAESSRNDQRQDDRGAADDEIEPYEEVQISPPSVYAELDRNGQDETTNDGAYQLSKRDSDYDYVIPADGSPSSVYAELNRNRQDETTNDGTYQKLLKRDSDYVIPAHTEAESSYEEVGKIKTPPGYTELDNTKRVQDDSACYQKLIKK
ncbi:Hypothetical predicted protein [Paramuricea clavata]|uniref:Discoidin domain-containing protein n=1 Tax=Paramuricea clavata TaxID=317549 RepID=A0A7D9E511_PARCT|nr:Hypothetical predicted protein [Paramuricea clavata]